MSRALRRTRSPLSWSSGKDCAWALHVLRRRTDLEVVGLLTTFNEAADRVAMHAVRRELVEAQAAAAGLPLFPIMLPHPLRTRSTRGACGRRSPRRGRTASRTWRSATCSSPTSVITGNGDWRVRESSRCSRSGRPPDQVAGLARRMLEVDGAVLTCVDPKQLSVRFVGRPYDATLWRSFRRGRPCGRTGRVPIFCFRSPEFSEGIPVDTGEAVERDSFWFVDPILS